MNTEMLETELNAKLDGDLNGAVWVAYRKSNGDMLRGIVLQQPLESTTGIKFVFVDNFANRVRLTDIVEICDS